MPTKHDGLDSAIAEQVRKAVEQLLPALLAERLPGLVAEQMAAMGISVPAVQDAVPDEGRQDAEPRWIRDAREAVADYGNQLTSIDFDPEGAATTSAMRGYHWIATEALAKATRILDEAGPGDESRAVYVAVGRGRNALIRLAAVRDGRPIPVEVITADELTGPPKPERAPHTAERFVWKGNGDARFLLDRPFPNRTVLLTVDTSQSRSVYLKMMERTAQTVRQVHDGSVSQGEIVVVPPKVTHLEIEDRWGQDWAVRYLEPDTLPALEDMARAARGALYRHTSGDVRVTLQCLSNFNMALYLLCDCTTMCRKREHKRPIWNKYISGEARREVVLPKESGILSINTGSAWLMDIKPEPSSRN